jgi:flagellar protein FliL
MSDTKEEKPKKKGKGKLILFIVAPLVLIGGGVGGGLFAAKSGLLGGVAKAAPEDNGPKLVPKSEQKRVPASGEGGEGGKAASGGEHPVGVGGDKYASTYYTMEKEFTANLQDSSHYLQVGLAVSTPYDDSVISNLKTHEIAVRSSILLALGDTTENEVFTDEGKQHLQARLTKAINDTLKQKEGFGGVGNVYFTNFVVQ